MEITYLGPFDVVEIERAPGVWVDVAKGASVDLPEGTAKSFLVQDDTWALVKSKKSKPDPEQPGSPDTES